MHRKIMIGLSILNAICGCLNIAQVFLLNAGPVSASVGCFNFFVSGWVLGLGRLDE